MVLVCFIYKKIRMKLNQQTAHPWHGIAVGNDAPMLINAFIEIVPTDTIKYEIDKASGWLKVDRPQRFSNVVPCLYGFIPQTYCKENIKNLAIKNGHHTVVDGDKDPLDICVLSSTEISRGAILLEAIPIGGFKMIDKNEADDKIIAVLKGDEIYNTWHDIEDVPESIINKLKHYFLTYKNLPYETPIVTIDAVYNKAEAHQVILAAMQDYTDLNQANQP
jgi:inorganic pyrophosphatase